MIRFEDVSFVYGNQPEGEGPLFQNIDLKIDSGEYVSLIGPNGSGKTSLAMLIKGLISPTAGKIFYKGKDLSGKGVIKGVGYLFSNPENQIVSSLVLEDIAFGPENQGKRGAEVENAVQRAVGLGNISHLSDLLTHQLSGGDQQKVVLSGILAMDVDCILFDEAVSMIDPVGKREIFALLKKLNRDEHKTVIHITHRLEDVLLADRVIMLQNGKIAFDDTPDKLIADDSAMEYMGWDTECIPRLLNRLLGEGLLLADGDMKDVESVAMAVAMAFIDKKS